MKNNFKFFGLKKFKDYRTCNVTVRIQGKLPAKNLYDYYQKYFEQSCYCMHDCCGCWFTNLVYIKRKGTIISMQIGYARNL